MTQPVKIGIVGLGRAGWGMHCEELQGREDKFQIVAACDILPGRCEKMAERYGCKTYARIEDLLADPDVELADIATRSCDHYAHARLALAAGKHVLLEKPMCTSYVEAQQLVAAAERAPGSLYIRHNRRFDPDFLQVKEIIASGILGEVYEIRLARHGFQRRNDWQTLKQFGGGMLLNWGPHIIDHALRLLDSPVISLFGDMQRVAAVGDAEDHVKIVLKAANGRVVDLEISGGVAIGAPTYLVFGTRGSLSLTGDEIRLKYLDPGQPLESRQADPSTPGESFGQPETLHWIEETLPVKSGSAAVIWDELYGAIREGKAFRVKLEEALQVMQIASAVREGTAFGL
jgi:scyllo-inositol 2-dehydrogenase (NADP+)